MQKTQIKMENLRASENLSTPPQTTFLKDYALKGQTVDTQGTPNDSPSNEL